MTIEDFIQKTPRVPLVIGAFALALTYLLLTNPPRSKCDIESEPFRNNLVGILHPRSLAKKGAIPPTLAKNKKDCQYGNSPGACFPYFNDLRKILDALNQASDECRGEFSHAEDIYPVLSNGIEVIVRLAWGEEPPVSEASRQGWLQDTELSLFCGLNKFVRQNWEEEEYQGLQLRILSHLPAAKIAADKRATGDAPAAVTASMSAQEALSKTLFKFNCSAY